MKSRILLVDDDHSYRDSLKRLLEAEGHKVLDVPDPVTGIEKIGSQYFDLIISDLEMEEMTGNDFVGYALRIAPEIKTIILTGRPTSESEIDALDNNVDYYLTKDAPIDVLLKYVEKVLKEKFSKEQIYYSEAENLILNVNKKQVTIDEAEVPLTRREYDIIKFLIENKGRTLSRKDFFDAIWDIDEEEIDERTIDVHIKELRSKLKLSSIVTVRGFGYKWQG